jgi:hypothetical protein
MEVVNLIKIHCKHICKCHHETLCITKYMPKKGDHWLTCIISFNLILKLSPNIQVLKMSFEHRWTIKGTYNVKSTFK